MRKWQMKLKKETVDGTLHALGICAKAGKLLFGTPMVCEALAGRKKPYLVLTASDNSEATDKRIADKCTYYGVRSVRIDADGDTLAHAVGKSARLACVAVTDGQLCRLVDGTVESNNEK